MKNKIKNITIILIILTTIIFGIIAHNIKTANSYNSALEDIKNKNWANAKSKLTKLKDYKDSQKLLFNVKYNYYLELAENKDKNKDYSNALDNYKTANKFADETDKKIIDEKIIELEKIIEIEEQKKQLKREEELKEAEQKRKKIEQQERLKKQQELADLNRIVKKAFIKVEILNVGDSPATGFNFYTYRQAWNNLSYEEQKNVLRSCIRYVELKENVDTNIAYKYTRIISIESGLPMAYMDMY